MGIMETLNENIERLIALLEAQGALNTQVLEDTKAEEMNYTSEIEEDAPIIEETQNTQDEIDDDALASAVRTLVAGNMEVLRDIKKYLDEQKLERITDIAQEDRKAFIEKLEAS